MRRIHNLLGLMVLSIIGCGKTSQIEGIVSSPLESSIVGFLAQVQNDPVYKNTLSSMRRASLPKFVSTLPNLATDQAFTFGGRTYRNLHTSLANGLKSLPDSSVEKKLFPSVDAMLSAHGATMQITASDVKAYLGVTQLAFDHATRGTNVGALDQATVVRAMNVAMALTAAASTPVHQGALGLADPSTLPTFGECAKLGISGKGNDNWFCAQDNLGTDAAKGSVASIGYMSQDQAQWLDAYSGVKFAACPTGTTGISGGWGWANGASCHENVDQNAVYGAGGGAGTGTGGAGKGAGPTISGKNAQTNDLGDTSTGAGIPSI